MIVLAALCFSLGMVQKSSCFNDGWNDGDARYTHMCYSDMPYLYSGRGLAELNWPYTDDPQVRSRYQVMEYPVVISYWAWSTAWVTHWVSGSPDLRQRYLMQPDTLFGDPDVAKEVKKYVVVNAIGLAAMALLSAWLLTLVNPRRPWDAAFFAASPVLAVTALVNWDLLAVAATRGGAGRVETRQPAGDRAADRRRHRDQALSAVPARRGADHLPAPAPARRVRGGGRRRR